ncbi:MAG: FAD-binding oxidoreductase [Candidatus Omnitrophica bacterium]|nr:FAD-binding oxidoreductase [Candidatus Omnitrophota bacterium]
MIPIMNMHRQSKSYLIVGQGIAGSLLAWHLMKAGHSVTIVDQHHHESSSMISAGIINPITGQRLAMTPQFDVFLAQSRKTYSQISAELRIDLFVPKPIIRVLRSAEELARCYDLNTTSAAKPYIAGIHKPGHYGVGIHDPYGTLTIAQGGYLQTQLLLTSLKKYFLAKGMLIDECLAYSDLILTNNRVQWKSLTFDAVIFCEGFKANKNLWFKNLPYSFAKGEMLKIEFESASLPDAILCQQQWCLPTQKGTYLAGSTYDRANINTIATPEGQSTILKGLNDFIPSKVRVIEAYAAVRPVMLDQKPVVGMHPAIPTVGIFNGFASKGILWAPYYAEMFARTTLPPLIR